MRHSPSFHLLLAVAVFSTSSFAADRADLARLSTWQAKISANPCALSGEARLLQIHALRDRLGVAKTRDAIRAVQSAAKDCRRIGELGSELLARLDQREGQFEQAQSSYRQRGFLSDFLVAGPFDNEGGSGMRTAGGPEKLAQAPVIDQNADMIGRDDEPLRFRPMPTPAHSFGYNDLFHLWDDAGTSCGYAVATLSSQKKGKARLKLGASGSSAVWWNGALTFVDSVERQAFPDRAEVPIEVRVGPNRVLVKTCAELRQGLGFFLRIADEQGRPWPSSVDHKASVQPPLRAVRPPKASCVADELVHRANTKAKDAQAAIVAAWYLLLTGSDDPKTHTGRDLAKRACALSPSQESCFALASLSLDRSEQLEAFKRAAEVEPGAAVFDRLARLELAVGHIDEAQSYGRQAQLIDPESLDTKLLELELLAGASLQSAALEKARQLLAAQPTIPAVALAAFELSQSSETLYDASNFASSASQMAADELGPVLFLARRAAQAGHRAELQHHAATVLALDGDSVSTLTTLAWWHFGLGDVDRAVELLDGAVQLAPRSFAARLALGRLLAASGRAEEASAQIALAAQLKPQDADLRTYLGAYGPSDNRFENVAVLPQDFLAWRDAQNPVADARFLVDQWAVEVLENGLSRKYRQIVVELLGPSAVQQWREHWIQSSSTDQLVQILCARVYRKDGSISSGSPTASVPVSEPWYRLYYDVEAHGITMPSLQVGDVVEISYRIDDVASRNELRGYFGDLVLIEESLPKVLWRYSVTAPKARTLRFNDPGMPSLARSERSAGQSLTTLFEAHDVPAKTPESGMPGPTSVQRYLHVSTYDNWESLGNWYSSFIAPGAVPDDRLRQEVNKATAGLRDSRSKAAAIYRWVVTNTRYVGLEFGIHGYKPYKAALVAARGFGDCKDKANLLVTMLRQAGVEAEVALVRTRHGGDLDTSIASLTAFDHAIAYVPGLDLWLDGTAEQHGFEDLPFPDQGVLALRLTRKGPILGRTPVLQAMRNRTSGSLELWIQETGAAKLHGQVSTTGDTAAHLRRELETEHTRRERFEQLLSRSLPGVKVENLKVTSLDALDSPVSYTYEALLSAYARTAADGSLEIPVDQGQEMTKRFVRLPARTTALIVGPAGVIERRSTVHVPAGFKVAKLPPAVELATKFGSVKLLAKEVGATVEVERRMSLDIAEVQPEEYAAFTDFCRAADEATSGRIILRRAP
ncbi:MAG: DUF3857 domain-containing protein [Myxococcota bacterium]|jgi:transglutaminase-like putative cysteine protease/tetratricopeptide (TPR) repeat protein|nr:DUF3857 domain-containing protein [Myxococcota bacterium]